MSRIQDFREQYPQYQHIDDERLVAGLRDEFFPDVDAEEFRRYMGLPDIVVEDPGEPGVGDLVEKKMGAQQLANQEELDARIEGRDAGPVMDIPGMEPGINLQMRNSIAQNDEQFRQAEIERLQNDISGNVPNQRVRRRSPLSDQLFAGFDEYRANRALATAFDTAADIQNIENPDLSVSNETIGGGYQGISGISAFQRRLKAKVDPEYQARERGRLAGILQTMIDRHDDLTARAATVEFSPETQDVVNAESFGEALDAVADDPITTIAELSLRSLPNMLEAIPSAAALSLIGGGYGFAAGAGAGSARVEYRASFAQALRDEGVDISNAESLLDAAENPELMQRVHKHALTRAGIIGTIDTLSGGLASRNLTPFVKNLVAREVSNAAVQSSAQAVLEGAGEAAAQLATVGEVTPGDVIAEAAGGFATAPIEVGAAAVSGARVQQHEAQAARIIAEVDEMIGSGNTTTDGDISPTTGDAVPRETPTTPDTEPVTYFDPRLKRDGFRATVERMSSELNPGGGISFITDDNDVIIGRTSSENPGWFQTMNQSPEHRISVAGLRKAINKAMNGEDLGVREARAVGYMLDTVTQERLEVVDYAREQLEQIREVRRRIAGDPEDPAVINAGEVYEEQEYSADMNATSRVIFEQMNDAIDSGVSLADVENIAREYEDTGAFMQAIEEAINEARNKKSTTTSTQEPAVSQEPGQAPESEPGTGNQVRNEQSQDELDPLTGLETAEAFQRDISDYDNVASISADNLELINNQLGQDAGDAILAAVGDAVDQHDVRAWRTGDNEFHMVADTSEQLQSAVDLASATLKGQRVNTPRGQKASIDISSGIGKTPKAAARARRKSSRSRSPVTDLEIKPPQELDMMPGTNYVGLIGQHGELPVNANHNYIFADGRRLRIPKQPVRREHILALMQKRLGNKIYQGRIRGKMRLGFYRLGSGEIRIKNANDIEVAAHEVGHWFDDRYPWIQKLYAQHQEEVSGVSYDVSKLHEGFAEFMRLFFTQEHKAVERAPSFYDAWMEALDDKQELKRTIKDVQEMIHAWTQQGARARGASKQDMRGMTFFDRVRAMMPPGGFLQDGLDGLRTIKKIELDLNAEAETVAYNKIRIALGGSNGVLEAAFFFGTPGRRSDGRGLEFTGEALRQIFGKTWGTKKMAYYLMARRAQELKEQGRENLLRDDEITELLKLGDENPEFADIAERFYDWNKRMLDFYQDMGILSPAVRDAIEEMNKNYVPFNRVIDNAINPGRGRNKPGGNPWMRLRGGTHNVNNVFENIINNTGLMIRMAMINDGKRDLYTRIAGDKTQKGGLYATKIPKDIRPVIVQSEQVLRNLVETLGMSWSQYRMAKEGYMLDDFETAMIETINQLEQGMDELVQFWQFGLDPTGDVDYYMDNGEKVWFEIGDRGLMDSLKFMGPKGQNWVYSIMGGFSATLRRGVVSLPVFQIKNIMRDMVNAWMLSRKMKAPFAGPMKVLVSRLHSDPDYQEMVLNGGGFANRVQGLQVQRKLIINPTRAIAAYDRFMSRFENAARLAEYKANIKAGTAPRVGSLLSRDISTDFAMRGSNEIARFLSIGVPFLNARAQGLYRLGRQFTSSDLALSYAMRGIGVMGATLALYAINRDDERYKQMDETTKDLYWVHFTGDGEDDLFLAPKPFESGMLWGTLPERMMEFARDRDGDELADAVLWMALETFNMDPTLQAFQPWIDLSRNKNFAGSPIVPFYLQGAKSSEQYQHYTSESMIALGKKLNISPIQTEHVVRGYLGTMGTYALAASDAMVRHFAGDVSGRGEPASRGETWRENIVVRMMIDPLVREGPPRRTKYVNDLYELVREAEEVATTTALMMNRQSDEVETYLMDPENASLYAVNPVLQQVRRDLNSIRKSMDMVRSNQVLTADQKRVQLWELTRQRNQLARDAVSQINEQMKTEQELAANG